MRDDYEDYPDLEDKEFLKWLVKIFVKLGHLRADILTDIIIADGSQPSLSEERVITESVMHIPLVYLYRRYKYEKAKPEADRIAGQLTPKKPSQ